MTISFGIITLGYLIIFGYFYRAFSSADDKALDDKALDDKISDQSFDFVYRITNNEEDALYRNLVLAYMKSNEMQKEFLYEPKIGRKRKSSPSYGVPNYWARSPESKTQKVN